MFSAIINAIYGFFRSVKNSFLRLIAECAEAVKAARAKAAGEKSLGASVGEHAGCAVCELCGELFKNAVKIFISSLLASFFGGRVMGRFLPVHAGFHRDGM